MNNDNCRFDADLDLISGELVTRLLGADISAVFSGVAGKVRTAAISSTRTSAFWGENLTGRDNVQTGLSSDDYATADGFGVNERARYHGREFEDVDFEMSHDWAASRGILRFSGERAWAAGQDALNRETSSN